MPAILTGSNVGARSPVIDLTAAGAMVVRDATKNEFVKIIALSLHGTSGAGAGDIVIRQDSATGEIVWRLPTVNSTRYDIEVVFANAGLGGRIMKGCYLDALNTAWAANSSLVIHTS